MTHPVFSFALSSRASVISSWPLKHAPDDSCMAIFSHPKANLKSGSRRAQWQLQNLQASDHMECAQGIHLHYSRSSTGHVYIERGFTSCSRLQHPKLGANTASKNRPHHPLAFLACTAGFFWLLLPFDALTMAFYGCCCKRMRVVLARLRLLNDWKGCNDSIMESSWFLNRRKWYVHGMTYSTMQLSLI